MLRLHHLPLHSPWARGWSSMMYKWPLRRTCAKEIELKVKMQTWQVVVLERRLALGRFQAKGVPTLFIRDGKELPWCPVVTIDGSLQDPVARSGWRSGLKKEVSHLKNLPKKIISVLFATHHGWTHLFQVNGDGDKMKLGSVLQGRWLPPSGDRVSVNGSIDRVSLVGFAGIADSTFKLLLWRYQRWWDRQWFHDRWWKTHLGLRSVTAGQCAIHFRIVLTTGGIDKDIGSLSQVEDTWKEAFGRGEPVIYTENQPIFNSFWTMTDQCNLPNLRWASRGWKKRPNTIKHKRFEVMSTLSSSDRGNKREKQTRNCHLDL